MSALTDRITKVLREHVWFNSEECVAIGLVSGAHCRCGLKGGVKVWCAHVASVLESELQLTRLQHDERDAFESMMGTDVGTREHCRAEGYLSGLRHALAILESFVPKEHP